MARQMSSDRAEIFRAVIKTTNDLRPEGFEQHFGPYQTHGAAAAAVTRHARVAYWEARSNTIRTGKVQRAEAKWEDVG